MQVGTEHVRGLGFNIQNNTNKNNAVGCPLHDRPHGSQKGTSNTQRLGKYAKNADSVVQIPSIKKGLEIKPIETEAFEQLLKA